MRMAPVLFTVVAGMRVTACLPATNALLGKWAWVKEMVVIFGLL